MTNTLESTSPQPSLGATDRSAPIPIASSLLDDDAVRVVQRLRSRGFETYLVGGCVRDMLVGRPPKDFDIATAAKPDEIRALFGNSRIIGRRFRLVQVYFRGGRIFEVSTFRANPTQAGEVAAEFDEELESRRTSPVPGEPESEATTEFLELEEPAAESGPQYIASDNVYGTPLEDACRRDFSVNGLFFDPVDGNIIDYVRGIDDIERRRIRTIGNPQTRFREDPVRILRGIRLSCRLGFEIEPLTYAAMEDVVGDLHHCSAPRLLEETLRLLRGGYAEAGVRLSHALDALRMLLPQLASHMARDATSAQQVYTAAAGIDAAVQKGVAFDDAMLLAALSLPLAAPGELVTVVEGRFRGAATIEEMLAGMSNARLPRRLAERTRALLASQRTLAGEQRRRRGLGSFRRHPMFADALEIFEIYAALVPRYLPACAAWRSGGVPVQPSDSVRRSRGHAKPPAESAAVDAGESETDKPTPAHQS